MAKNKEQSMPTLKAYDITQGNTYFCTVFSIPDARSAANQARARMNKRVDVLHKGDLIFSLQPLESTKEDDFNADDNEWDS